MGLSAIYCLLIGFMCGRTACTLARDDILKACSFQDRKGKRKRSMWKDAPGGQQYKASYNMAPGSFSPVVISSQHFRTQASKSETDVDHFVMPMKWGLVPRWHKEGSPSKVSFKTSNCRGESMLDKATFKIPLQKGQRCVAVMDGFYEWKTTSSGKQPYFFQFSSKKLKIDKGIVMDKTKRHCISGGSSLSKCEDLPLSSKGVNELKQVKEETKLEPLITCIKDEISYIKQECSDSNKNESQTESEIENKVESCSDVSQRSLLDYDGVEEESRSGHNLLMCAAVYDVWHPSHASSPLYSYSVITVAASSDMSWCHHRMPAVLTTDEEICDWLDFSSIPLNKASGLIHPKSGCLTNYPVSKDVNNSRYQCQDCIKPLDLSEEKKKLSGNSQMMMNWLKRGPSSSSTSTIETTTKTGTAKVAKN